MMKKAKKLLATTAVVLLLLSPVFFLFGNPLSWGLVLLRSNQYLNAHFPELDVKISRIVYDFVHGGFTVHVDSPTSVDTHFHMMCDFWGGVHTDYYGSVADRGTTFARHSEAYADLVADAMAQPGSPFAQEDVYALLMSQGSIPYDTVYENGEYVNITLDKDFSLDYSGFELDQDYDLIPLGAAYGQIDVTVLDEDVSVSRVAELLLELREYLDSRNIPFYAVELTVFSPDRSSCVHVHDFLYSDIYEEGLEERVQQAYDEYLAYQARIGG